MSLLDGKACMIMNKASLFVERLLKVATKPEDVEFLVSLLFDLKRDSERKNTDGR